MRSRTPSRTCVALLVVCGLASAVSGGAAAQPTAAVPPSSAPDAAPPALEPAVEVTPLCVSFVDGQVSFWRPGADDWAPARANTPLAPGDMLYAGPGGNVEVQLGTRAFVRGTDGAQLDLDNHETDFIQFRVTGGSLALDLRHSSRPDPPSRSAVV